MSSAMLISNPKDGSLFSTISGNLAEYTGKITFSEAKFQKIQDGYQIYCHATTATQLEKFGDKNWKWEPLLLTFAIHDKEWQRSTKANGEFQKVATKPQTVEVYLCQLFDSNPALYQDPSKAFKGHFRFEAFGANLLITGKDANDEPVPDTLLEWIRKETCTLEEVAPNLIQTLPAAGKKPWGGGTSTQTMKGQLLDKWDFACTMLMPYVKEDAKPKTFLDMALLLQSIQSDDPEVQKDILFLFDIFLKG